MDSTDKSVLCHSSIVVLKPMFLFLHKVAIPTHVLGGMKWCWDLREADLWTAGIGELMSLDVCVQDVPFAADVVVIEVD